MPPDSWCFARAEGGVGFDNQGAEQTIIASDTYIHIPSGFERGWIYELVYTGRDPLVLGLGHIAVRDFVSFLRYSDDGAAALGSIENAYAWGRSQTGRCLRDFVYRGFNADASGRKVFDGVLPHVAGAGRMWLNHRFANVPYYAGKGGVTPPGGNQGGPGSAVSGWAPELVKTENRLTFALLIKL